MTLIQNIWAGLRHVALWIHETLTDAFEADSRYEYQRFPGYSTIRERLAILVGFAAIALPLSLIISNVTGFTRYRDTISHYYYAIFMAEVLVGLLFFVGAFLLAYKGESKLESRLATLAGVAAFGIALLPTSGVGIQEGDAHARVFVSVSQIQAPASEEASVSRITAAACSANGEPVCEACQHPLPYVVGPPDRGCAGYFNLFDLSKFLHAVSTAIFFIVLILFAFYAFRRIRPEDYCDDGKTVNAVKKRRNAIYLWTGVTMTIGMGAILANEFLRGTSFYDGVIWRSVNATFWLECLSISAFGIAWLVKSKFLGLKFLGLDWRHSSSSDDPPSATPSS
ncbi:MAG: hypothetical protein AAF742_01480 [Pseudomonadota bacterium]